MDKTIGNLTVFFEGPFWVGVFECIENGKLSVSKVTFGAEPKDSEIYNFILKKYCQLKFSPAVAAVVKEKRISLKRMQRDVKYLMEHKGIGTKSRQALKLQQEQMKQNRKQSCRERSEAEKQRLFELKQQKKKDKHRGR